MSACFGLLALVHLASAAVPPTLSLREAVALARLQHPELRRAELAVEQVLARRVGAALVLQHAPELSVDVGRRHDSSQSRPASTGLEWTVRLGQMVDVAGQRGLRLREVGWAVQVAQLQRDEARLQAAASAANDYLRAQATLALVEVSRARAELALRVLHMVHHKERAGATGGLERTLAELEHGDARAQLERALATQEAAKQALWYSLGLPASEPRALEALAPPSAPAPAIEAPPVQVVPPQPAAATDLDAEAAAEADGVGCEGALCGGPLSLAALLPPVADAAEEMDAATRMAQRAVLQRPQGQALLAAQQALEAAQARVARELIPSPTLAFEAQKQQPGQQYFGGGISLALPVGQRAQGARAELRAQVRRNQLERRLFAAACARESRVALRQAAVADSVWRIVHDEQLPAAQAHVDMTVASWRAGKLEFAQVVQSLRYLTEARARHTDAIEALWRARIERQRVTGELL